MESASWQRDREPYRTRKSARTAIRGLENGVRSKFRTRQSLEVFLFVVQSLATSATPGSRLDEASGLKFAGKPGRNRSTILERRMVKLQHFSMQRDPATGSDSRSVLGVADDGQTA